MFRRRKAARDAIKGEARVVRMAPTAKAARRPDKLDVECSFRLSIEAGPRGPYEVDLVQTVPHAKMVALGQSVPVLITKDDPPEVSIDLESVPDAADRALAAGRAAEQGDVAGAAEALGFTLRDPPEESREDDR